MIFVLHNSMNVSIVVSEWKNKYKLILYKVGNCNDMVQFDRFHYMTEFWCEYVRRWKIFRSPGIKNETVIWFFSFSNLSYRIEHWALSLFLLKIIRLEESKKNDPFRIGLCLLQRFEGYKLKTIRWNINNFCHRFYDNLKKISYFSLKKKKKKKSKL